MKNYRKNVILVAVLGVLLLVLVFVLVFQRVYKQRLENENSDRYFDFCVFNDVRALTIIRDDGSDTVYNFGDDSFPTSVIYNGVEYSDEQIDIYEIQSILVKVSHFSIGNNFAVSDSEKASYGLSPEQFRVSALMADGSQTVLLVGNLTSDKNGVYVCRLDDNQVFVAEYALYQYISTRFESLLNRTVLNLSRQDVKEIDFVRRSTGDKWTLLPLEDYDNGVYLEPRYQVTYPMNREPKNEMIQLANLIMQLRVSQYVPISSEDYISYGLDAPEYCFTILLNSGETIEVNLSMELGGYYYGYCSYIPYTFSILSSSLPGLNTPPLNMIDSYVMHGYLDDVRSVNVTIKDTSFVIDIMMASDFISDETIFTLDQRNAKVYTTQGDCYALMLFESIFWMPVSRVDYEASPLLENAEATISVVKTNSETISLKLVPNGDNEFYCFINDRDSGFIVDRSVLYKDYGHQFSGFGVWDAYLLTNEAIDNKNVNDVYDRP